MSKIARLFQSFSETSDGPLRRIETCFTSSSDDTVRKTNWLSQQQPSVILYFLVLVRFLVYFIYTSSASSRAQSGKLRQKDVKNRQ